MKRNWKFPTRFRALQSLVSKKKSNCTSSQRICSAHRPYWSCRLGEEALEHEVKQVKCSLVPLLVKQRDMSAPSMNYINQQIQVAKRRSLGQEVQKVYELASCICNLFEVES